MKPVRIAIAALGVLGLATAAQAECDYPEQDVEMPDGTSATKDEMIASQQEVKSYMADMEAYLACLKEEHAAAAAAAAASGEEDPEAMARRESMFTKRHDAAVDQMHLVGARFNEQVRAFKDQSD